MVLYYIIYVLFWAISATIISHINPSTDKRRKRLKYPRERHLQDTHLRGTHSQKQLTQKKYIRKEQMQINTFIYINCERMINVLFEMAPYKKMYYYYP